MSVSVREMLEAGVHFGHQSRSWNPKMAPFIFGSRNKIHIIDLEKTETLFNEALNFISGIAAKQGNIMFVGTKRAARKTIKEEAERVDMPYVDYRWLGGMLTNFKTVKGSIKRLKNIDSMQLDGSIKKLTKKEGLKLERERIKLQNTLGGIKEMRRLPDVIFIVDIINERNALMEARTLGIPVVAITDTNTNPDLVDYIVPGNDDGILAIRLYVEAVADAILDGQESITVAPVDKEQVIKKPAAKKTITEKTEKTEKIEKIEKIVPKKLDETKTDDTETDDTEIVEKKPAVKKPAVKKPAVKKPAVKEDNKEESQ